MAVQSPSPAVRHVLILALIPLAILLLYISNPVWRIYSDHGFLHQSIVYRLMNGGSPPTSPLLAGENLLYLWGHHYLVAAIARLTDVPLSWIFASLNLAAVSAALLFGYSLGSRFRGERTDGLFAALLAVVSCNILTRGPHIEWLSAGLNDIGFPYRLWQYTALVIAKFYNLNSNGLGIAAVLGWLLFCTIYLQGRSHRLLGLVPIGLAALAIGFLYPVYMLNITATAGGLFVLSLFKIVKIRPAVTLLVAVATAVGLALTIPYVLSVSAGRTTAAITFSNLNWLLQKGLILALAMAIPASLIFFNRTLYLRLVRERPETWSLLALFAAASAFLWPVLYQSDTEYKHLLICTVALGLMAAPGMTSLYQRSKGWAALLIAVLLVPFLSDWLDLMNARRWPAFQPVVERGSTLHAADAEEDRLYVWIRANTDVNDAFIDDRLLMPVLGQRSLFIGLDQQTAARKEASARSGKEYADGWEWRPQDLLLQQGYDPRVVALREKISRDIFASNRIDDRAQFDKRVNTYLVARSQPLRDALKTSLPQARVFSSPAADLYLISARTKAVGN